MKGKNKPEKGRKKPKGYLVERRERNRELRRQMIQAFMSIPGEKRDDP